MRNERRWPSRCRISKDSSATADCMRYATDTSFIYNQTAEILPANVHSRTDNYEKQPMLPDQFVIIVRFVHNVTSVVSTHFLIFFLATSHCLYTLYGERNFRHDYRYARQRSTTREYQNYFLITFRYKQNLLGKERFYYQLFISFIFVSSPHWLF